MNTTDMNDLNIAFTTLMDKMIQYIDDNSKFNKTVSNLPAILGNMTERILWLENKLDGVAIPSEERIIEIAEDRIANSDNVMSYNDVNDLVDEKFSHYDPTDAYHFNLEVERIVGHVFDVKLKEALEELDMKIVVS